MRLLFSLIGVLVSLVIFSQDLSNTVIIQSGMPLNNVGIIGKEVPNGEIKGSHYLFDDWVHADILINDQKILQNLELNVDLLRHEVDVLIGNNRKVLPKSIVSNFKIVETGLTYYWQEINGEQYVVSELLEGNSYDLLEEVSLTIKEPTYNVALDMGSRDTQIVRKINYWIRLNDGTLEKISNSNKRNCKIFQNSVKIKNYVKSNGLDWKSRKDLIQIAQEANM